jgi:hypothetical protein
VRLYLIPCGRCFVAGTRRAANLTRITAGESELVSIKAEKKLELVFFFSVREASNHDWML